MDIDKKLNNEITLYCKENGLNKKEFINKLLKKAFNIEKYGEKPFSNTPQTAKIPPEIEKKKEKWKNKSHKIYAAVPPRETDDAA